MSSPIPLELPPRDPCEELRARLQNAPVEHAEALLAAYDVLQELNDHGVLELLRGALGSGDRILESLTAAVNTPESIRAVRNFVILAKVAAALDPEMLCVLAQALPQGLVRAKGQEPPGLSGLLKQLWSEDSRRGLAAVACVLEAIGRGLASGKAG